MGMHAKRRAFVISPIGGFQNGKPDDRRAYADEVFKRIITPALNGVSASGFPIEAIRGDHDREPKDIMSAVIASITEDDVIIALISEADGRTHNANVYYELGIAHCAGRPVVLLKDSRQKDVPFDLSSLRFVSFDPAHLRVMMGRDPNAPGGPVEGVREAILNSLRKKEIYTQPFGRDIALGRQGARDRFMSISPEEWSELILDAEQYVVFAGTTLKELINPQKPLFRSPDKSGEFVDPANLETLLSILIGNGVNVTALFYHESHPILHHVLKQSGDLNRDGVDDAIEKLRNEIDISRTWWKAAATAIMKKVGADPTAPSEKLGRLQVHQVRRGCIYQRVTLTERRVVATANFYDFAYNSGPCVDARAGTQWHTCVRDDMLYLARLNPGFQLIDRSAA
jgi:hypothetical protein